MNINVDYLDRVRRIAALYTKQKTSDLMEGNFSSLLHGRSLDFDDLREYRYGDDVADIDWKASSKAGKTLVRRYFAERKHNVVFICDTGSKMRGDTPSGESKTHLAMMAFGVSACLFDKQGVNYALAVSGPEGNILTNFLSGAAHLERLLAEYQKALSSGEPKQSLNGVIENVATAYSRHLVLVIITDGEGLYAIDDRLIRRMVFRNDVFIFKLEDAFLTTPDVFDLETNRFEDPFLAMDASLRKEEERMRRWMEKEAEEKMTPYRVFFHSLSGEEEIIGAIAELFRRRKGALA